MTQPKAKLGAHLIHIAFLLFAALLLFLCWNFWFQKRDYLFDTLDRYSLYITTKDITVTAPGGLSFSMSVSKSDRQTAWKIYTQLTTRVAATEFDDKYDSLYLTHQSLHTLFGIVRDALGEIPLERIQRDDAEQIVKFYTSILNTGLRPYLSKWHIPLSQWVDNEKIKTPSASYLEIEKSFPQRKEILEDMKAMNERMKIYAEDLLKIAKKT